MARIFVYDGREYPDINPNLSVEQVRDHLAAFIGDLHNASHVQRTRGDDTIYEFHRRVGTKGAGR